MEQLGDYLVRRLVGEGGMGKVYEAEERLSKRRVALKVLHPELAKSEQGRRLFLNEMQILAHLEHPNIVRSLASTEVGGELVMVLEYLEGRTLRTVLHEAGKLPWTDAVGIVSSVASALSAAHGQVPPIIHRDLKPENIMILDGGTVKVMDFGIAKVIEALHQTNTQSVGTLQYMSPEQIDAHTIDHRSDLYCLGLVFYEMIAGHAPFQSASPRQLLNMQCTAKPPPLDADVRRGLPKGVEQLIFQLLEKAPEDRPYLSEDVVTRLEPFEAAGAPAATSRASGGGRSSGSRAVTPHRASQPSGGDDAARSRSSSADSPGGSGGSLAGGAPAASAADPRQSTPSRASEGSRAAVVPGRRTDEPPPRADTIALVERVDTARQVSTRTAVAIVVVLSLLAGLAAYFVRASSGPADPPTGATAVAPSPPLGKTPGRSTRP